MTVKTLTKSRTIRTKKRTLNFVARENAIWKSVEGLWKKQKINPLQYQKKLRKEADRV